MKKRSTARPISWLLITFNVLIGLTAPARGSELTADSLMSWKFVSDAQASRSGDSVAYVVQVARADGKGYDGDIWLARTGNTSVLISGAADDRVPRWLPDGRRLAFLSNRDGRRQLYIREADGVIWQVTNSATDVISYAISPNGEKVALLASDTAPANDTPVVKISERLVYRLNGSPGFRSEGNTQIWETAISPERAKSVPRQLTRTPYDHGAIEWSASSDAVYFTANTAPSDDYENADQNIYNIGSSTPDKVETITTREGGDDTPKASADGRWLAYFTSDRGSPARAYSTSKLALKNLTTGVIVEVPDSDGAGEISTTDSTAPATQSNRLAWSSDSQTVYFTRARAGRVQIAAVDVSRLRVNTVTGCADGVVRDFTVGGKGIAAVIASPEAPADVVEIGRRCSVRRLSSQGVANVAGSTLGVFSEHQARSFDGLSVQYWKLVPPGYDSKGKSPAILYIHGGPHDMYARDFFHEFQLLADKGYVVLLANPRGSSGYGTDFGNIIQGKFPGDDAKDLLAVVDDAIAAGGIDAGRLGVAGGSGGGVLSSWIIGQTTRFRAAIVERSITDWGSFVGTSDLAAGFTRTHFPDFVWRAKEAYWARSSLSLVDKVETPVLVIHSEQDYRTPLEQGLEYYTALKLLKKPAKLAVFPSASHSMYREGTPEQRIARLKLIVAWFDKYLAHTTKSEGDDN